jgi:pimeloyl-ACP methyl ester carboxylesterase
MFTVAGEQAGMSRRISVVSILGGDDRVDRVSGDLSVRRNALVNLLEQPAILFPRSDWTGLTARAITEALGSNLFAGTSPESWSPLGSVDPGAAGLLAAERSLADAMAEASQDSSRGPRAFLDVSFAGGRTTLTLRIPDDLDQSPQDVGAITFSNDAFIAEIPPGTHSIYFDYEADPGAQTGEVVAADTALRERIPDGELIRVLVWRTYSGSNTLVTDGISELAGFARRISLRVVRTATVLVGRIAFAIHRRVDQPKQDPFAIDRLLRAESNPDAFEILKHCPRLDVAAANPGYQADRLLIAVHGTMSTAVPMATALYPRRHRGWKMCRFEHDTWLRVADNAALLADLIQQLAPQHVVLIAHSRGGLVARHAVERLEGTDFDVKTITLGTPHKGTPIVAGARGMLLGFASLMGAARAVPGSSIVMDAHTRLAGLLLKGELPAGLRAMDPDGDYVSLVGHRPLKATWTFGGKVDPEEPAERFSIAALGGFANAAFSGEANDLVVSQTSAHGYGSQPEDLDCDHFSYFEQGAVVRRLRALAPAPPPPRAWPQPRPT